MEQVASVRRADVGGFAAALWGQRAPLERVAVVASLLVAIGASSVAVVRAKRWRKRQAVAAEVSVALRDYAECLLGAPLEPYETAMTRLRRIEAGLPERGESRRVPAEGEAWPLRCAASLDRAQAATADYERSTRDPAWAHLRDLVARARVDPSPEGAPELVDDLLNAAMRVGVTAVPRAYPPRTTPLAPPPASPLVALTFRPLPVPASPSPDEVPSDDPASLRVLFQDVQGPAWTCAFTSRDGEPFREARCGQATPGVASGLGGQSPRGPGFVRTARDRFDRFELVRTTPDARLDVLPLPSSLLTVALYGDALVGLTAHGLFAREVPAGRAPLGPVVNLGEVSGLAPEIAACRSGGALVVGVKTFEGGVGERTSWRTMAARDGATWKRTPDRSSADVGATFTCDGHEGTWTWFNRHVVTQVRCNADRCETHASPPFSLPWDVGGPIFAADLGGRALLLGLGSTQGPLTGRSVGSVRMRIAPLLALDTSPDVVLFSDAAHEGASVRDVWAVVRDRVALVVLRGEGPHPFRALRVDASGAFSAVTPSN